MTDVIDRLKNASVNDGLDSEINDMCRDAVREIDRLEAVIEFSKAEDNVLLKETVALRERLEGYERTAVSEDD